MPKLLLLLFVALWSSFSAPAFAQSGSMAYDARVVVAVEGLDDAAVARLAKVVGREKTVGIEYSCTRSGVLVLLLSEVPTRERADVIMLVRRHLGAAGLEKGVEVLHVHVEASGVGKC